MWSSSRAAKVRIAKRKSRAEARIDSWPLVGVSLTLLIIFMLFPSYPHHGMTVADLPLASYAAPQAKAIRDDAIRISVSRDGSFFFRNAKIAPEDLQGLIRESVQEGAERKVYMTVDARARYADVEPVLDQIRAAGVKEISFLVDKRVPR